MNFKQPTLTNFFRRKSGDNQESGSESDEVSEYVPSKSKSMYGQPMYWTRVRDVEVAAEQRVSVYDVEQDLQADKSLQQIRKGAVRDLGVVIFDPETFRDQTDQLTFDNYRLSEEQLLEYAKTATRIRSQIKHRAGAQEEEQQDADAEPVTELKNHVALPRSLRISTEELNFGREANPVHPTRKRRPLHQLNSANRMQIVKLAASKLRTCREIADMYNIKVQVVYDLAKDAKKQQVCFVKKKEAELRRARQ